MSAWGPGNFENDDAMDWVTELETYSDDGPIIDVPMMDCKALIKM